MSDCIIEMRIAGKAYPRTCPRCGLGPCKTQVASAPSASTEMRAYMWREAGSGWHLVYELPKPSQDIAGLEIVELKPVKALCKALLDAAHALDDLLDYSGGADSSLDDEYVTSRAHEAMTNAFDALNEGNGISLAESIEVARGDPAPAPGKRGFA